MSLIIEVSSIITVCPNCDEKTNLSSTEMTAVYVSECCMECSHQFSYGWVCPKCKKNVYNNVTEIIIKPKGEK